MSGRCAGCNNKLLELDMKKKIYNPITEQWEYNIFCSRCTPRDLLLASVAKEKETRYEDD